MICYLETLSKAYEKLESKLPCGPHFNHRLWHFALWALQGYITHE